MRSFPDPAACLVHPDFIITTHSMLPPVAQRPVTAQDQNDDSNEQLLFGRLCRLIV